MSGRMRELAVAGLAVLAVTACSDSAGPAAGAQTVSLSFSGVRPAGVAPTSGALFSLRSGAAAGDSLVLSDGTNTLVITSAEVLIRKIELKRTNVSSCDSSAGTDDCEEFELGAILVDVPLAAGAATSLAVSIDSGTYSRIEFDIHKLGSDSVDAAFLAAHPTWPANTSIRVTGTYNGTPFTFTTGLDVQQESQFVPPLDVIAGAAPTNVTIRLDLDQWFRNGTSGPYVNPATANQGGANKSLVDNNIKNAIKAFEDHDQDGDERDG